MSTNSAPTQDASVQPQARSTSATPAPAATNGPSAASSSSITSASASASQTQTSQQQQPQATASIIAALSSAFKSSTGESLQNDKIASLLLANMEQITALEKQGRLTHAQIQQVGGVFLSLLFFSFHFFVLSLWDSMAVCSSIPCTPELCVLPLYILYGTDWFGNSYKNSLWAITKKVPMRKPPVKRPRYSNNL